MYVFGSGVLIGTDSSGNSINFGLAQEVTLEIQSTTKSLYGQNNFPVAIGSGTRKLTGKAKLARISGHAFGSLFFGQQPASGSVLSVYGESANAATYVAANAAHFIADMGVVYAASGLPLKLVTAAPSAGQYEIAAGTGTYTLASADVTTGVLVNYTYANTAVGQNIAVVSSPIGPAITFSANLFAADPTTGKQFSVLLYNCVAEKLSFGTKLEDFLMPELDFQCFANAAGQVCQINMADVA